MSSHTGKISPVHSYVRTILFSTLGLEKSSCDVTKTFFWNHKRLLPRAADENSSWNVMTRATRKHKVQVESVNKVTMSDDHSETSLVMIFIAIRLFLELPTGGGGGGAG